jgi:hypothetical protein
MARGIVSLVLDFGAGRFELSGVARDGTNPPSVSELPGSSP